MSTRDTIVWQPSEAAPHPFADHDLAELPTIIRRNLSEAFDSYAAPVVAVKTVHANHLTALNVAAFGEWALALDRSDDAGEVLRLALQRRPILEQYASQIARRLGIDGV
jgi:hypothetical protein